MIICSLHQPSFEILELLDDVLVLDEGYTMFFVGSWLIREKSIRLKRGLKSCLDILSLPKILILWSRCC